MKRKSRIGLMPRCGAGLSREGFVSLFYACSLQPLAPFNAIQSLPLLVGFARERRWLHVLLVSLVVAMSLSPYSFLRLVAFAVVVSVGCVAMENLGMSVGEVLARFIIMGFATYFAAIHGSMYVTNFVVLLNRWVEGLGESAVPIYVVSVVICELSDLSRHIHRSILQHLEDPSIAAAVVFMLFLVSAAVELGLGYEALANRLAELAYISLVIAVVAQIYQMARGREGRS